MIPASKEDQKKELRQKFHDLSNALGLIIMRGGLYSRSMPRDIADPAELKEQYLKTLDEHGKTERDALKASEAMIEIRRMAYQMLEIDATQPIK